MPELFSDVLALLAPEDRPPFVLDANMRRIWNVDGTERRAPRVPPPEYWPEGFEGGDGVTGWADRWIHWRGFGAHGFWPLQLVDVTPAAWWHDLWYWLGYYVSPRTPIRELPFLKPLPTDKRSRTKRFVIDRRFRKLLMHLGLRRWRANRAYKVVRKLGNKFYLRHGDSI